MDVTQIRMVVSVHWYIANVLEKTGNNEISLKWQRREIGFLALAE